MFVTLISSIPSLPKQFSVRVSFNKGERAVRREGVAGIRTQEYARGECSCYNCRRGEEAASTIEGDAGLGVNAWLAFIPCSDEPHM